MTVVPSGLVSGLLDLGERRYGVDWAAVAQAVQSRLGPTSPLPAGLLDPASHPSYWCVPLLVGDYAGADRPAVLADLEDYVAACVLRHLWFEWPRSAFVALDDDLADLVGDAYRAASGGGDLSERFAAKCQSWAVLLAFGTRRVAATTSHRADLDGAVAAIVAVYSCTQVLDDWHDRPDDAARGHWNLWADEPVDRVHRTIGPLVRDATRRVGGLRRHPLRDALAAQLRDNTAELADLVQLSSDGSSAAGPVPRGVAVLRRRLEAAGAGLWRDFVEPGVSAGSTECISGFMASVLSGVDAARPMSRSVASTLLSQARPSGGWGYREDVAEDADSTAWVLLAAHRTGVAPAPGVVARARDHLLAHQRPGGGFATYDDDERQRLTPRDLESWSEPDPAVSASAVLALAAAGCRGTDAVRAGCGFVASRCTERGWTSMWWCGTAYPTWLAVWALTDLGEGRFGGELDAAREHLLRTRHPDGAWGDDGSPNAFDTSVALLTLLRLGRAEDLPGVRKSAALLASWQDAGGAWPGGARMLAPGVHPDLVLRDRWVTTACAVAAAHAAAEHLGAGAG